MQASFGPCSRWAGRESFLVIKKGRWLLAKPKSKPTTVLRIGSVSASTFEHEVESEGRKRTIRSVSLQRRYKDGDETKYSSSFGIAEIPLAIRVLQLAQRQIEDAEAEINLE